MAKFNLSTDKSLIVRGGVVSLPAGEVETEDSELIAALRGALYVEEFSAPTKQKPRGSQE